MMGRPSLHLCLIVSLELLVCSQLGTSNGNIGCLFKKALCEPSKEFCFDDLAFGRCMLTAKGSGGYRHKFELAHLKLLKHAVVKLNNLGFNWSDAYTQCQLQILLYSIRHKLDNLANYCDLKPGFDVNQVRSKEAEMNDFNEFAAMKYEPSKVYLNNKNVYWPSFPSKEHFRLHLKLSSMLPNAPENFDILDFEDFLGFQRRERFDVKKPGPGYQVNSFAFKKVYSQNQLPIKQALKPETDHELFVAAFIMCGVVAGMLTAAVAYYTIRSNSAIKKKLQKLPSDFLTPSKDYQDLCRARMASKASEETAAPIVRAFKTSQESDSPSSRSSTSSWSEEPALSNMDISTGHMVLAYMEDHLKNKDRLALEWTALCAYEAEPCSQAVAKLPVNAKKNRYVNSLPYDHARVMLNELANASGSNYINASTIVDHDPRNPAYIATQGPLASSVADMWQMVWEQGCVVIVVLTRLTENDLELSYRYWPEDGSELYHIYEVHLVSEHIWCDDYLVRSFYLKNLKTSETRTVTQFHFLSWPDGGVPNSTKALLEFRRKVNKSFRGRSCPIIVHCSDGIGRTGTYCLLDMVLNRMAKGAKEIDIAATLEHIRDQRGGSVSTKEQFQFVLQAVAEEVQAILRVLPQSQASAPPLTNTQSLLQPKSE